MAIKYFWNWDGLKRFIADKVAQSVIDTEEAKSDWRNRSITVEINGVQTECKVWRT